MTTIKTFIAGRPVLAYFAPVFAISWGSGLIVLGPGAFLGTKEISFVVGSLVLISPAMSGVPVANYDLVWAAALWVVVAAGAVANRGQLSEQSFRRPVT